MTPNIFPLIPKHTVYVEPFAGGASVFFAKPWPNVSNTDHYREVLNDLNGDIINLYRVFQDKEKAERLIHRLEFTLYSRDEQRLSRQPPKDDIERAWNTYVDCQMSFSNKMGAGWKTSVYSRNPAATWANKISALRLYLERMSGVQIENDDALEVIKRWDSPQTLFYCDPPYPSTDQGHYSGYTHDDFNNLIETLKNIDGSFILSCYGFDAPDDWEVFTFDAHCTASGQGKAGKDRDKSRKATSDELGNRKRTEYVYRKLGKEVRSEIRELFNSGAFDCFGEPLKPDLFSGRS